MKRTISLFLTVLTLCLSLAFTTATSVSAKVEYGGPRIVTLDMNPNGKGIYLRWNPVKNAKYYVVQRTVLKGSYKDGRFVGQKENKEKVANVYNATSFYHKKWYKTMWGNAQSGKYKFTYSVCAAVRNGNGVKILYPLTFHDIIPMGKPKVELQGKSTVKIYAKNYDKNRNNCYRFFKVEYSTNNGKSWKLCTNSKGVKSQKIEMKNGDLNKKPIFIDSPKNKNIRYRVTEVNIYAKNISEPTIKRLS